MWLVGRALGMLARQTCPLRISEGAYYVKTPRAERE
jgi:hypothetical protein